MLVVAVCRRWWCHGRSNRNCCKRLLKADVGVQPGMNEALEWIALLVLMVIVLVVVVETLKVLVISVGPFVVVLIEDQATVLHGRAFANENELADRALRNDDLLEQ